MSKSVCLVRLPNRPPPKGKLPPYCPAGQRKHLRTRLHYYVARRRA